MLTFILDANNLAHRTFHVAASKARATGDKEAQPDMADVSEWVLIKLDLLRDYIAARYHDCERVCVFDPKCKSFRATIMPEDYKSDRTYVPGVFDAVDAAKEAVERSSDWTGFIAPDGYEADDLIASIAHQSSGPAIIHSPDKDFHQCLSSRVEIIKNSKAAEDGIRNEHGIPMGSELLCDFYTAQDFDEEFGFPVARWVDYQCLVGDAADNIAGLPRCGPVAAKRILQRWPDKPLSQLDPDVLHMIKLLNKPQYANWGLWMERLEVLQKVFTLKTDLSFSLGDVTNVR